MTARGQSAGSQSAPDTADIAVLAFGGRRVARPLRGLTTAPVDSTEVPVARRLIVVGAQRDLATVLTRLMRAGRLDVEVAFVSRRWQARRALRGVATRVPLIRDETGTVITAAAHWLPLEDEPAIRGEAVVDDVVLFDGSSRGIRIEPMATMPGLRARPRSGRRWPRRWVAGRAAQLGTTGARVVRDGVPASAAVRRSTFYRHVDGWLRVR